MKNIVIDIMLKMEFQRDPFFTVLFHKPKFITKKYCYL